MKHQHWFSGKNKNISIYHLLEILPSMLSLKTYLSLMCIHLPLEKPRTIRNVYQIFLYM